MKLLAFAASLRAGSFNRKLIAVAADAAARAGARVELAAFREFDMPLYDGDLQDAHGMPPGAEALARRIEAADGLLIASPEYNYSIPGTLKNAIDWISRRKPQPLVGKSAFLLSTSTGIVGGARGLWQLRIPLEGCGVWVNPDMFPLPEGPKAFTADGKLVDPHRQERLEKLLAAYLATARKLAGS